MNHAHEAFTAIQREGAAAFAHTRLASDLSGVTRPVRRARALRATAGTAAGVAVAGAGTLALLSYGGGLADPAGTPSPAPTQTSPSPSPSPTSVDVITGEATVSVGDRSWEVSSAWAETYDVDTAAVEQAIIDALPPEADGNPEGWLFAGTYDASLEEAAAASVSATISALEDLDVPREQWQETLTLASIAVAEIEHDGQVSEDDLAGVGDVLRNRLEQGLMLEVESPLRYYADSEGLNPSDDGWLIDTPYNTFMYEGLPPGAIGALDRATLGAAVQGGDSAWLYFASANGRTEFASEFEDHRLNLIELGLLDEEP